MQYINTVIFGTKKKWFIKTGDLFFLGLILSTMIYVWTSMRINLTCYNSLRIKFNFIQYLFEFK
jgi:hypothetical protein